MNRREAILSGTLAADRLHQQIGTKKELTRTRGPVDVFGALLRTEFAVIFRPLDALLGACLTQPAPGVIISTQRPLTVQRFTGAHELGHVVLHHNISLDGEEILLRDNALSGTSELQANAFASEFLIPRWLPAIHGRAQGWNRESLQDPAIVYQLALRLGASFEATCIALRKHEAIDERTFSALREMQPKKIKQALIPDYQPDHWYRDVWVLTERDKDTVIAGQPDDLFLFRLNENSAAGYLWDITELKERGFLIVEDHRELMDKSGVVGGSVERVIAAQSEKAVTGEVRLAHRRPWQHPRESLEQLHLNYDLRGKENGLPRAQRLQFHAA